MEHDGGERRKQRQERLKERFLDLADAFVKVRMKFLRFSGVQPPDEADPPAKKNR